VDAGTRAASVAAELLDFYREPALIRPRYLHGELQMPHGALVLRFALARFTSEGPDAIAPEEREPVRVAALAFIRQVCLWERASHYQVLCLAADAAADDIKANYHLLIALIHPDRDDTGWPAGCAQRANQAYAVLADPAQRSRYDDRLRKAGQEGVPLEGLRASHGARHSPHHARRRGPPAGLLARFAVVAGVVAALFIVQAWWVGQDSPHYSLLERAIPSAHKLREALPDVPRFLNATVFVPAEELPRLEEPRRMAALTGWTPRLEPAAMDAPPPPPAPAEHAQAVPRVAAAAPASAPSRPSPPIEARPMQAVASGESAPSAPQRIAQSKAAPAPAAAPVGPLAPSREQVEGVVALLVGYYDAGDADRLVGLFDPEGLGFWGEMRTRSAYSDFFGSTRERRLKIDRLSWHPAGATAQARGEAIVLAEFQDGRPRLERRVPVEFDIVLRESQPRIARMILFPLGQ
jgi:hypothetical protein